MIRRTLLVTAGALLLGLVAGPNVAKEKTRAFQLVYHSDTRGYYRPCG